MLTQSASWPGVAGVLSCEGTISHGISPSTFILTSYPQVAQPLLSGKLVLSDGVNKPVVIPGARVSRLTATADGGGQKFTLEIQDRRWKWRSAYGGFGAVDGQFNIQDKNGKFVPWTIRSPVELAAYCLDALGEVGYVIDLPVGLTRADGADLTNYLLAGQDFRQTIANPRTVWDKTPPAEALARLADYFGRRVIYQPIQDRVVVSEIGNGGLLPDGGLEVDAPGVAPLALPAGVAVAGVARFQMKFHLEAVGKEWDGKYVPVDTLSYAPRLPAGTQVGTVTYDPDDPPPVITIALTISWTPTTGGPRQTVVVSGTSANIAGVWTGIINQCASKVPDLLAAAAAGDVLTLTGQQPGQAFDVTVTTGEDLAAAAITRPAGDPNARGWQTTPPPAFTGVVPTDQLAYTEARELARRSVWKCYRIVNRQYGTAAAGGKPILVPWLGPVARRQQIILQDTKVEQVVPTAPGLQGAQAGGPNRVLADYYNGYSQDQQATVTGAVALTVGSVTWNARGTDPNTNPFDRVYVPFRVDPREQMIVFDEYVYALNGSEYVEPKLTLETGCLVEDANTNQVIRWVRGADLGGPAPAEWAIHGDVQVGIIGQYGNTGGLTGVTFQDATDAESRAAYYLNGMAARYTIPQSHTRQYAGVVPIEPDGAIQQVTWSVGPAGPTTHASLNTEHHVAIPDYPARRRAENLPPNAAAALANQTDPNGRLSMFGVPPR